MSAALALGACSTNIADLPSPLGLPAGAPARPDGPLVFPAVHDMPPDRQNQMLNADQVKNMEADLTQARERQQKAAGVRPAPVGPPRKKSPPTSADPPVTTENP